MRSPIVPIAVAFSFGVLAARFLFLSAPEHLFWIAALLLFSCILLGIERFHHGLFVAWMGFFLAGAFLAKVERAYLPMRHVESLARRGELRINAPAKLEGWAKAATVRRPGGEYFDLEVERVVQGGRSIPADGTIRIYYFASSNDRPSLEIEYGQRLSVAVRDLRRPRNYMTEGQYNFEAAQRRQGIYFTGAVRASREVSHLRGREGSRFAAAVSRLRTRLLANIDRMYPPERDANRDGPVLKAMILGDDNWLPAGVQTAFQESGTYHLLVVSGLHVSALALGVFWLLTLAGLAEWIKAAVSLLCAFVFVLLTNSQIPVARAALMVALYFIARFFYRKRAFLNSIAAAALILLIAHPGDLFNASFQLSFLSVTIIACMAVPMGQWTFVYYRRALGHPGIADAERMLSPLQSQFRRDVRTVVDSMVMRAHLRERASERLRKSSIGTVAILLAVADAFAAAALIQLGLTFSMAIFFHRVSWSGLVANPLVIPLSTLLVPVGFAVLWLSLLWWPAAVAGARVLSMMVSSLHWIVDWSLRLSRVDQRVPEPPTLLSIAFVLALLAFAYFAARRSRLVWLPMAALALFGVLLTVARYRPEIPPGRLDMTALDVGQGDSLFLTFPRGTTMLVDGGGAIRGPGEDAPTFDVGERIVAPFLWARRIRSIDYVVLTHAHSDHLGGLVSVIRDFRVGELWIGRGPRDRLLDELLQVAKEKGVPVSTLNRPFHREIDGVGADILWPPADWAPRKVSNNDSLVMRLTYGSRHLLLPGDAERETENRLTEESETLTSDVLKVGHHGSKTSSTLPFLQKVSPRFGIVSVGAFRRFGHPHQEVLDALAEAGVRTYRTDKDGSVTVGTNGNRIEFSTFRERIAPWPPFELLAAPMYLFFAR